jgi:hypothetical protein
MAAMTVWVLRELIFTENLVSSQLSVAEWFGRERPSESEIRKHMRPGRQYFLDQETVMG